MSYTTLSLERDGDVVTIWMDRPDVFNAFDEALINELSAACREINADETISVVILAGRGRHFSAGADLNWMKRASTLTYEENLEDARIFAQMLHDLAHLNKPTIARVQRAALGGGTGLTAACDMAVAADNARFAVSEVKFGIIPAVISPYVLRAIGPKHALRYFQTAEMIDAEEAYRINLVNEVVPEEELDNKIAELVDALRIGGTEAQFAAKDLISAIAHKPIDGNVVEETAKRISKQRMTDEAKEGISAFLEKRKPYWLENN